MTGGSLQLLAGGLWREAVHHRRAMLRRLGSAELGRLLDDSAAALPAERTTALLALAVESIGEVTPVGAAEVRELSIGDRERLVLAVRRMLHGDRLECVLTCRCGEILELALSAGALLGEDPDPAPNSDATTAGDITVRVRAATGADHEAAAHRACEDPAGAARALVASCILEAWSADGQPAPVDDQLLERAETLLAQLDPGAELVLEGECPACGERLACRFDPISHLWSELEQQRAELEHEVHVLALHYHWSEREIIALGPARRARYLTQLDRHLVVR